MTGVINKAHRFALAHATHDSPEIIAGQTSRDNEYSQSVLVCSAADLGAFGALDCACDVDSVFGLCSWHQEFIVGSRNLQWSIRYKSENLS